MRVRLGWSGETENNVWQKADVELNDEDLTRMLIEADMPIANGTSWIPVRVAYNLLLRECEILLLQRLVAVGYPTESASTRSKALASLNAEIFAAIKDKLAAQP